MRSGEPIPFEPRALGTVAKAMIIDSSRALRERMLASGLPLGREVAPLPGAVFYSATPITVCCNGIRLGTDRSPHPVPDVWVKPEELPDRLPVFPAGGVKADADGNLWIQTINLSPAGGGLTYDVISRSGSLVDRVQLPAGAGVVAFAPGGTVFLALREGSSLRIVRSHRTTVAPR
jgi:hypothetical protein